MSTGITARSTRSGTSRSASPRASERVGEGQAPGPTAPNNTVAGANWTRDRRRV
ncbi:hypothetical protein ACFO5R_03035 [Halosolutus amylolyticus]|uniref:Uncharacterized protein n=1 Tax=Halosolutus amylolyticus TaxID=2932267 RepID=A0ABD5PK20_9EURY|nr:hypothetical protein [Halosolutus amylolyticus]